LVVLFPGLPPPSFAETEVQRGTLPTHWGHDASFGRHHVPVDCAYAKVSGGYIGGAPPVPIPNTEVKPSRADGTARFPCGRVGRCRNFSPDAPPRDHTRRGASLFPASERLNFHREAAKGAKGFCGVGGGATSVVAAQPPNKTSRALRLRGGFEHVTLPSVRGGPPGA